MILFMKDKVHTKPRPSNTASTIPAENEEQLSWLMSRGTEMLRVIGGSLSMIISAGRDQRVVEAWVATVG